MFLFLFSRRSGSNVSGLSSETGMDDQSVNVCYIYFCKQVWICIDLFAPLLINMPKSPDSQGHFPVLSV